MLTLKFIAGGLLFASSASSAAFASDYGVFEMPAKMKGDTLVCNAAHGAFEGSADLIRAFESKKAEGFEPVTDFWRNYEQQELRKVTSVYCIRMRPRAPASKDGGG